MHVRNKAVLHVQIVLPEAVRKEVVQAAIAHKVAIPVAAVRKVAILAAVRKDKAVHHARIAVHKVNLAQAEVSHAVTTEVLRRTQLVVDPIPTKDVLMMVKVVTTAVVVVKMAVARINLWFTARRLITHLRKLSFVAA
jgi:hypothetical protein